MNLFDNILNQSKNKFLGTQPSVPSTPSFMTPQAPRTVNYTAPQVQQKPSMTLFSDEQKMFQKMKADNLDDNTAYSMLKKRRMDILGGNDITQEETDILKRMQADNVPVKQAVSMIQQRRKDQFNKKYEEGNLLQKGAYNALAFGAGNLETLAKYSWNALDFITGGTVGFWDEVKKMEQVTQSPEFSQSSAFKAGTYAPDVALAVSPIGWGYLAGAKWLPQLAMRSGVVGAWFGWVQPILEQWSDVSIWDIATGAATGAAVWAVASPVLSKAFKYGQAGYYGWLEWAGKSIARDVKWWLNAITPSGANISTKANRFNANEIREFTRTTGQSPWDFATSRGMTKVWDDAVVEATRLWQASKDQADDALKAIKWRFRFADEWEDLLKTTIDDLETRLINTKSPDSKRISQLKAKYEDSGLTMSEINEIKRAYSNNYKYSFVDVGSEAALRSRNLQDAVRKWQFKVAEENGLTNLKEINKTTQGWKMFADSLSKKLQWSSANNALSLTDAVMLSGATPENIALYLWRKLASSSAVKQWAIKLFSKKTKPSIIEASMWDIQNSNFLKNVNRGVSGAGNRSGGKSLVRPVGLIEAPKWQATGAKNFRVNQPKEAPAQKSDITSKSIIRRPWTKSQAQVKEEVQLAKQAKRQSELKLISDDIASATERARYGGTGNTRIETQLNGKMDAWKMTREEAIDIATEILKDVQEKWVSSKYKYIDKQKLESYINDLYSNKKMPTFDDLLNEPLIKPKNESKVIKPTSPQVKPVEKKVLTPKKESATMGDMETKKLKKPKALRVYDVIKSKNNDITAVPFDDFYSLARVSTKWMTKDKAWWLWMNKMIQKVEKWESVDIEILKKYPLAGSIIKDFLKTRINPFE